MRVLVCGDRNWSDREYLYDVLDRFHAATPIDAVIEGEARGADTMAREWAESQGVDVAMFPADWKRLGRKAGPIRNGEMLRVGEPDVVLAFHVDIESSRGTRDMVERARRANVPTYLLTGRTNARLRATQKDL